MQARRVTRREAHRRSHPVKNCKCVTLPGGHLPPSWGALPVPQSVSSPATTPSVLVPHSFPEKILAARGGPLPAAGSLQKTPSRLCTDTPSSVNTLPSSVASASRRSCWHLRGGLSYPTVAETEGPGCPRSRWARLTPTPCPGRTHKASFSPHPGLPSQNRVQQAQGEREPTRLRLQVKWAPASQDPRRCRGTCRT